MIDLRSDTLTMPTPQMLATVLEAAMGDDGRAGEDGRGEDPTVNDLEDLAAELTGKEAAVLLCSGTMGNTTALLTYCRPGDRILVDETMHIYKTEKAAFDPRLGQLVPEFYSLNENLTPDIQSIEEKLSKKIVSLLCIENTHNYMGGICTPVHEIEKISKLAGKYGVPVHMDGARLFNVAVALSVEAKEICKYVDSVMFCISKGLGAPVGSLLCGQKDFILEARNTRKLLGGSMRQAGVIAAPGIYALKHNMPHLWKDHEHTQIFLRNLGKMKKTGVQEFVHTNIVMLYTKNTGLTEKEYCRRAREKGLLIGPAGENKVRLVFYSAITGVDAVRAAGIVTKIDEELCS